MEEEGGGGVVDQTRRQPNSGTRSEMHTAVVSPSRFGPLEGKDIAATRPWTQRLQEELRLSRAFVLLLSVWSALVVAIGSSGRLAAAENGALPHLFLHESYVEDTLRTSKLAIEDPIAVFAYVLNNLSDRVKVYPTENYYYFSFVDRHVRYAGNIRLDVVDRDEGKVHFAYYEDLAEWKDEGPVTHVVLGNEQGVSVEKLGPLSYRVSYGRKTVQFDLNDLSEVKPPPALLGPDETYLGPIFDDSAIRFFLVFNSRLKIFHYILDETVPVSDQFTPAIATSRILIGKRTGFAFYRDHRIDRKILIGVFAGNARVNNYFDGPFDQLPDNFIKGEELRNAILAAAPELAGKIDRFGIFANGTERYLIGPYRHYRTEEDLLVFDQCATDKHIPAARYYECFVFENEDNSEAPEVRAPRARKKMRTRAIAKH